MIAAKLRRQIGKLKSDNVVSGSKASSNSAQFEAELEKLIEEDVRL